MCTGKCYILTILHFTFLSFKVIKFGEIIKVLSYLKIPLVQYISEVD